MAKISIKRQNSGSFFVFFMNFSKKSKKIAEKFGSKDFLRTFAIPNENNTFETTFPNSSVG
jgi:hypothetical protein